MPQPMYNPSAVEGAFQLRYSWTGWPSKGHFPLSTNTAIEQCKSDWETDGLRVLEFQIEPARLQLLFSVTTGISPVFLAGRAKGRLDHAFRSARESFEFSRKIAVRSVGDATTAQIDVYIATQVPREHFVDERYAGSLAGLQYVNPQVDLSAPTESARGRYWCNLHLVLVTNQRYRFVEVATLEAMRDACLRVAEKKEHGLSRVAIMPDHLHLALRSKIDEPPIDVVFAYQNDLAHMLKLGRIWSDSYYVGTFGEYGMGAIRQRVDDG